MRFVTFAEVAETFHGKRAAIVGGGPSVLDRGQDFVDSFDVVVRINNYRAHGHRCDVFYSYFGGAIKNTADDLKRDGVKLCMAKCPDAKPLQSEWHERNNRQNGIDFRYIYELRHNFWFCDTFVPDSEHFMRGVNLLNGHIPTTGFSAILDVLACKPAIVFLTGFDFFVSRLHSLNEPWKPGDPNDPIGHRPDLEAAWLAQYVRKHLMLLDPVLSQVLNEQRVAA